VNEKKVDYKSEYFDRLVKEAPFTYGDHKVSPEKNNINWLDLDLIREGQEFVRRNFFSIMFAHFISLMMIFSFKSGRSVLLRTGESHKRENSITRYLSTVLHIKLWYETDFIQKSTSGAQDVYAVRKMHGAAARGYTKNVVPTISLNEKQKKLLSVLQADLGGLETSEAPWEILTDKPKVPMSQWDMVITQFCFLGFVVIHPAMFGFWNSKGIEGFVHMWAVLGRLLGIEDRFNLALHYKDRGGYFQIWRDVFMPEFKTVDDYAIVMWDALVYGLRHYIPFLRLNSTIYFMVRDVALVERGKAKNLFDLMTAFEKICYALMCIAVWQLKFSLFRVLLNSYMRFSIFYAKTRYMRGGHHVQSPIRHV
jgi:hypothetical protein